MIENHERVGSESNPIIFPRRALTGILLLDKPEGISSNQALGKVKRLIGARKAGHTGALDPLASGLLPLCFGEATKISGWLLDADKTYHAIAELGRVTDTYDREGKTLAECTVPRFSPDRMDEIRERFIGSISQIPPMYSALKYKGRPLYRLAREGVEIEREPRTVRIDRLQMEWMDARHLRLEVDCSKGTYIRSLVHDLGQALGCGATVHALRRTRHGAFGDQELWTLSQIENLVAQKGREAIDEALLSPDVAIPSLPSVLLDTQDALALRQGRKITVSHATVGFCRLYASTMGFFGVGEVLEDGRTIISKRLLIT